MTDDEIPPSLDGLSAQVAAISSSESDLEAVADVTFSESAHRMQKVSRNVPMRRGFFNTKGSRKSVQRTKDADPAMPTITGKFGTSYGPEIPDFLMVEPSEHEKRLQADKLSLLNKLKPTEESVKEVMQAPDLAAGFDDPEVMRAVQDIAGNPDLMRTKYSNNKKVQRFYAAMAGHVGQRLTSMGMPAESTQR